MTDLLPAPVDAERDHLVGTQSSDPERLVPARRVSFAESLEALPRHFAGDGNLIISHLIAVMSSLFPDGEDFFVRSVRHYRDQITDPALRRQVNGFIGQEASHGREHRVLNNRLAELGYPTKRIERMVQRGLTVRERIAPPISNLASTAALEHFTATLAELVLTDEKMRELIGDEAMLNVLLWHALEESEHKAVAFDVYRAVGGSERLRVYTMKATRVMFAVTTVLQVLVSIAGDPATYQRGNLRRSLPAAFRNPVISVDLWRKLRDYDRSDFHPDDRDTRALEARWRTELFDTEGIGA